MPSFVKPKGSLGGGRAPPVTPMSERQQMALLMQMTSAASEEQRTRSPSGSSSSKTRDRNERGETPLHLAAIKGDVEQVCRLLAHRADPNVADFAGWTPLHEACIHGWYEVAFRLVQAGANVNAKGLDDDTPLHDASSNGNLKLVKMLLDNGADIHMKNAKGKTPLDVASAGVEQLLLNPNLPIPDHNAPIVDMSGPSSTTGPHKNPTCNRKTSVSTRLPARSRDDKKVTEAGKQKSEETMDQKAAADDVYEFKAVKDTDAPPDKPGDQPDAENDPADSTNTPASQSDDNKRNFSEMADNAEETSNDDESRRKKRKDDGNKDGKTAGAQRNVGQNKGQGAKAGTAGGKAAGTAALKTADRKSPVDSPKAANTSDAELEDGKTDLKVPPLKIVIPQSTAEQESGQSRNGKSSSQRSHQALPYVVPSNNSEGEKEGNSGNNSPSDNVAVKADDKKEASAGGTDEQRASHQRVLRSSHRSGPQGSADRSSNNSSPQLQRSHSPSPSASPAAPANQSEASLPTSQGSAQNTSKTTETQAANNSDNETTTTTSSAASSTPAPVELHPRKRKMRPNRDTNTSQQEQADMQAVSEVHPHEQPISNCYQLFLNIRKQIDKRRRGLYPVQPKPPQGFKDYLINRCTYVLAGKAPSTPNITYPSNLQSQMKDLFAEQEKDRYKLRMQHVIEKEKLVLAVEQEILRVHGRAARTLANQSLPFSVCTILRDEEVYNFITTEREEKDTITARSRYNGRLFLSWLQDVDDKWEKVKEPMLLRHHHEAESLYAVQKMDWEWKLKELSLCDAKTVPTIEEQHVPMVHVSDDFNLPAN